MIVEEDGTTVRVLNKTASYIWKLADGTRRVEDIGSEISHRFDTQAEHALADTEEFCAELLDAGLISLLDAPQAPQAPQEEVAIV